MPRPKRTKVAPSVLGQKPIPNAKVRAAQTPQRNGDENANSTQVLSKIKGSNTIEGSVRRSTRRSGNGVDLNVTQIVALDERSRMKEDTTSRNLTSGNVASDILGDNQRSSSPEIEASRRETIGASGGSAPWQSRRQSGLRGRQLSRASSNEPELPQNKVFSAIPPMQNSILATGHIRRRARQPSIIRARSSSVGLEMDLSSAVATPNSTMSTFRAGTIRRRQRQPSIIGTAQKPRRDQLFDRQQSRRDESEVDDDDDNDFNPVEVESTPLDTSTQRLSVENAIQSTPSVPSSVPSNPRKRKLSTVQVPASQTEKRAQSVASSQSDSEEERVIATQSPISGQNARSYSQAPRPETPEPRNESIPPPESTSSGEQSPVSSIESPEMLPPSRRTRPQRLPPISTRQTRSAMPATQDSPLSSPPSLTHSPNGPYLGRGRTEARSLSPSPAAVSTAQLQALLPRRRIRRPQTRDEFDIVSEDEELDVSGLASDDDELTHLDTSRRRRSVRPLRASTVPADTNTRTSKPTTTGASRKARRRTYGRATTVSPDREDTNSEEQQAEVENDSLGPTPDEEEPVSESPENSQELEKRLGKELKDAVRKFAEIDEWELDFEDVSGDSSSLKDAR